MHYHGLTLSTTYCIHPTNGERYAFVSDQHGTPLESVGRVRWDRLNRMRQEKDGWLVVGTWPVAKQPKNVWER